MFAGTHPSMPTTVDLAADLALLLSRQSLSEYAMACEAAQRAAERCAASDRPSADALADLVNRRASVIAAEVSLKLVVDVLAARQAEKVSLDRASRELIGALICTALERLSADFEASEDEILATATQIQRLREVLDELGVEAADARQAGRGSRSVTSSWPSSSPRHGVDHSRSDRT